MVEDVRAGGSLRRGARRRRHCCATDDAAGERHAIGGGELDAAVGETHVSRSFGAELRPAATWSRPRTVPGTRPTGGRPRRCPPAGEAATEAAEPKERGGPGAEEDDAAHEDSGACHAHRSQAGLGDMGSSDAHSDGYSESAERETNGRHAPLVGPPSSPARLRRRPRGRRTAGRAASPASRQWATRYASPAATAPVAKEPARGAGRVAMPSMGVLRSTVPIGAKDPVLQLREAAHIIRYDLRSPPRVDRPRNRSRSGRGGGRQARRSRRAARRAPDRVGSPFRHTRGSQ